MTPSATRILIADILRRLRWRAPVLLAVMGVNCLIEGLGLVLLFPLLGQMGLGQTGAANVMGRAAAQVFSALGVRQGIGAILALIVVVFVIQHAVFLCQSALSAQWQQGYVAAWRTALFDAMLRARWRFFTERRAGELMAVLIPETQRLSDALFLLGQIAASALFIVVFLALTFAAAWPIALLIGGFALLMFAGARPLLRRGYGAASQLTHRMAALQSIAGEFLSGAKLIKATASEETALKSFAAAVLHDFHLVRSLVFYPNLIRSIYEVSAIGMLAVCLWLGLDVIGLDPASIMVSLYMFLRIYQRQSVLQQNLQAFQNYVPAIVAVTTLLQDAEAEAEEIAPAVALAPLALPPVPGVAIALKTVTVSYDGAAALADLSLDIPAGVLLGVAGASGAGKSTLVDCILGLVPPDAGSVEIAGRPLPMLPIKSWRRAVGYVAQDTFLFNASIRENIAWGHPDVSDADIERAARQAHAHDFIHALPRGFDTEVGDRGVRLSGGQRQRIGLARALVGHIRLLVLDEATSALDTTAEREVMKAIAELRGFVTIIIIAHRLSTLRDAETICLMADGRIIESGTWENLVKPGTRFHDLWTLQSDDRSAVMAQ